MTYFGLWEENGRLGQKLKLTLLASALANNEVVIVP